jgi:serine/threonine protein kinase
VTGATGAYSLEIGFGPTPRSPMGKHVSVRSSSTDYATAAPPRVLSSRYRLLNRIGRGGMADVYRAQDELLGRQVAVKLFRFGLDSGPDRERAAGEIEILASLNHPALVTVYDAAGIDEHESYLVLELVPGPSLREKLLGARLDQRTTAQMGQDVAGALSHIHAAGIVHRDIKPANILLDATHNTVSRLTAKLTDFGIARRSGAAHLTTYGLAVGTAKYASPEQLRGREVGPPSDVYSLGLVLIESLAGAPAYPGDGMDAALARLDAGPSIPPVWGEKWGQLLTAMTSLDPCLRPTAEQTRTELAELTGSETSMAHLTRRASLTADHPATAQLPALAESEPWASPRTSRRPRYLAVAGALSTLVAAAAVAVLIMGNQDGGAGARQSTDSTTQTAVVEAPNPPAPTAGPTATPATTSGPSGVSTTAPAVAPPKSVMTKPNKSQPTKTKPPKSKP